MYKTGFAFQNRKISKEYVMKRRILLALVISMLFVSLNSNEVVIERNLNKKDLDCFINSNNSLSIDFALKSYIVEDITENGLDFKRINVKNEDVTFEKGLPELPTISRLIGLDNEGNPYVNVISFDSEVIRNVIIFPNQLSVDNESNDFEIDNEFYSSGSIYPHEIVHLGQPAIMRDYRLVGLRISPFQYDPIKKELIVYSNVEFEILYDYREETINPKLSNRPLSKAFESIYSSSIVNCEL